MPPTTSISFEQLSKYFHLPINDVAKELGICATMLKKICRRNGIPRWPHRKIKSLNKMIENLEASLQNNTSEAEDCIKQEISILKNKKTLIMKNPSVLVSGGSSKRLANQPLEIEKPVKKIKHDDGDALVMTKVPSGPQGMHQPPNAPSSLSINQLLTPNNSFTPLTSYLDPEENEGGHGHPKSPPYPEGAAPGHPAAHWAPHGQGYYQPHSEYHYNKYNAAYQMTHLPPSPPSEYASRSSHMGYMTPSHPAYQNGHPGDAYTLPKMNLPPYSSAQQMAAGKFSPPQQGASSHQPPVDAGATPNAYQQQPQDPSHYPHQYKPSPLRFTHHPASYSPQPQQQQSPQQTSQQQQQPMVLRWVMEYDKMKK